MRLAMPRFTVPSHSQSFAPSLEATDRSASVASLPLAETVTLAPHLTLPATARDDLLGETFSCYISISNHTEDITSNVVIKAELQSSVRKVPLYDNTEHPLAKLEPGQCVDFVGREQLTEIGVHILACSCTYQSKANEKKFFQKFFKFNVSNPFTVENKVLALRSGFSILSRLTNSTNRALYLSSVMFNLADSKNFSCVDANPPTTSNIEIPGLPGLSSGLVMRPGDTRQFLFLIERLDKTQSSNKDTVNLGRLHYVWSSAMGERGQWMTETLQGPALVAKVMSLLIEDIPSSVVIHEPFRLRLTLRNEWEYKITPTVIVNENVVGANLLVTGLSSQQFGELAPKTGVTFDVGLVAHTHGLHALHSIHVYDPNGVKVIEFNDVIEFFVERERSLRPTVSPKS